MQKEVDKVLKWLVASILVGLMVLIPTKEYSVRQANSPTKLSKLRSFTNRFLKRLEEV